MQKLLIPISTNLLCTTGVSTSFYALLISHQIHININGEHFIENATFECLVISVECQTQFANQKLQINILLLLIGDEHLEIFVNILINSDIIHPFFNRI